MEETTNIQTKFCKECGGKIAKKAVICPLCGCQVEETHASAAPQQIVINNSNQNSNTNVNAAPIGARLKSKWVSILLCVFLGYVGAHKFYEGKIGTGLLYVFTLGFVGIGCFIDFFALLGKPNPYIVI